MDDEVWLYGWDGREWACLGRMTQETARYLRNSGEYCYEYLAW